MTQANSGFNLDQLNASSPPPPAASKAPPGNPSLPDTVNKTPPQGFQAFDNVVSKTPQSMTAAARNPRTVEELRVPQVSGVQTVEEGEKQISNVDPHRNFDAEIAELQRLKAQRDRVVQETAGTNITDHPPLKPGDKIQGPHDRTNREPTQKELEHGDLHRRNENLLVTGEHVPNDPPIDKNAPPDVPADPRKVAESRGLKFEDVRPTGVGAVGEPAEPEELPAPGQSTEPNSIGPGTEFAPEPAVL